MKKSKKLQNTKKLKSKRNKNNFKFQQPNSKLEKINNKKNKP